MSKSKDQEVPQTNPKDKEVADAAALNGATAAATGQQFSLEDLKAKGLDPAVYGYTESAE